MPNVFDGKTVADGEPMAGRFAIVVSRYNENITQKLLSGAIETLRSAGVADDAIDVAWVPGAFELPVVAKRMTDALPRAVICLGCVIRGHTPHFDYVAGETARGIARVSPETGVPVTFGVITADTVEQAIERAGSKAGNKGADAALSAIELTTLLPQLPTKP